MNIFTEEEIEELKQNSISFFLDLGLNRKFIEDNLKLLWFYDLPLFILDVRLNDDNIQDLIYNLNRKKWEAHKKWWKQFKKEYKRMKKHKS